MDKLRKILACFAVWLLRGASGLKSDTTGPVMAIPRSVYRGDNQVPVYLAKGRRVFTDGVLSDIDGVPIAKDADGLYTVPLTGKYLLSYYNSMTII